MRATLCLACSEQALQLRGLSYSFTDVMLSVLQLILDVLELRLRGTVLDVKLSTEHQQREIGAAV